ncbi:MAG TPA: replication initiation protein [Bacillota bacterium]|nr:replication initiation protein [Bacillota bacterium]
MARINTKKQLFDYESSIKKSNELSMAKLSHGLTLNQMQLLAYAIYCTQKDGKTEFIKADFEKKFGIEKYQTVHAKDDARRLLDLKFSAEDLENNYFEYWNVFQGIRYKEGLFSFKWSDDMVPHILELKVKYVATDLMITAHFKSGFSWTLYDYLRAHYGYWHKPVSKEALMKLFGVEERKTYQNNTGKFKSTVLDPAIKEINEYTELDVRYTEEKKGRSIVGFDLIWSSGKKIKSATKRQIKELKANTDAIFNDMYDFIDLNNEKNRERAILLVRESEHMRIHTEEPICITYEKADEFISKANNNLRELVNMLEKEKHGRDVSFYYNWLVEK